MNDTQTKGATHISDADFQATLDGAGDQPVLVDFYAEWCGPCKLAAPIIDKLSDEFAGKAKIVKLDVDENPDSARANGVMSIPTVVIYAKKDGKVVEVDRKIGFPGEQGYRDMLGKVVKAA